ncbi:metalloregulator ArsR/SmtB family transcription factor [Parvularcula sp. IMCC14364]|uniref:ArsR/SmtB family transcription factor n=1 Tax=Parvularcula sp. IMCC14364 TaxID=3067902 RepID=UPI0027408663|nr:metalloregulator ArsR/SmtB family transcription factor [Parvularcula sp. IMCC14364]
MSETSLDHTLRIFRAVGEETRLRIMVLLARGELTVTELTQILGQSQPRVSRHIKILAEAGVVERYPEGAWVFYRLQDMKPEMAVLEKSLALLKASSDLIIARDRERLEQVRRARAELAASYFQESAAEWDSLRRLHLPESDVEQAMRNMLGQAPVGQFVDLGTGTGRMLIVFREIYEQGVGFDLSREMLAVARARLEEAGVAHARIRQSDLFSLPLEAGTADIVCIHQVLHFLSDPATAISSAKALLKPGGRMLVADFASHELEFLRENHAHRRLGFSDAEVQGWAQGCGLDLVRTQTLAPGKSEKGKLTVKLWLLSLTQDVKTKSRRKSEVNA